MMQLSTVVLLLCAVILIAVHPSLALSGSAPVDPVVPVRQNPIVISGVGQECPESLERVTSELEAESMELLDSVVGQIECTYLGNC